MNQLIPVFSGLINNDQVQLVDARILHKTLNVISRFNDWVSNRIKEYGFLENQDFILITKNLVTKTRGGDRRSKDYHLTLDMAKELSMVERTEIGRQVRRYFIQCEKKLLGFNHKTTTDQRTPLRDAVNLLVGKKGLMYPEAYSVIHQRFNVKHIDELSADQVPMAIEYVHKLTLEAEWLPEAKRPLVGSKSTYHLEPIVFPNLKNGLHPNSTQVFFDFNSMFWMREMRNAPIATIIRALTKQGYDIAGVATEYKGLMHLVEIYHDRLERVEKICSRREAMAINLSSKLNAF